MTVPSPWTWHAHPEAWALVAVLAVAYAAAARRLGPRRVGPGERPVTRAQASLFAAGLASLWLGADWPIHDLAEDFLLSAHMVQHTLFTLAAVPLLFLGTPPWMLRALLPPPVLRALRAVGRPLPALLLFNGVLVFSHWPVVVNGALRSEPAHFGVHVLLFASAVVMWTPVLSPLLELPALSYPGRMLFLFLQSLVPTVPASFLTFGNSPLYSFYEHVPRIWGLSALDDQQIAGLVMKIVGGLILWTAIAVLFFKWFSMERRTEGLDALEWRDVDRALNRAEPGRR